VGGEKEPAIEQLISKTRPLKAQMNPKFNSVLSPNPAHLVV